MRSTARATTKNLVLGCIFLACGGVATTGCSSDSESSGECAGDTAAALTTCSSGPTLKGVDVSYYQGSINWAAVKNAGVTFAYARVSDGTGYPDSKFAANWPAMKKAGIIRGFYQFFRPGEEPMAQFNLLVSKVNAAGGLQPGDLPPVLDLEVTDGQSAATVQSRAKVWLTKVEQKFGIKPIVYTAAFMSSAVGTAFGSYPLWVANYGVTCPTMPSGWTKWKMWQNADNGSISGIAGGVDTDIFEGNLTALQAFALKPAASTPTDAGAPEPGSPEPQSGNEPAPGGDQGATLGSGNPAPAKPTTPGDPCASR